MHPDDPEAAATPRPGGLWSYDGGWHTPDAPPPADGPTRLPRSGATGDSPLDALSAVEAGRGRRGDQEPADLVEASSARGEGRSGRRSGDGEGSPGRRSRDGDSSAGRRGSGGRPGGRARGRRDGADGAAPGHPEDPVGDPESVARAICLRLLTMQPRTRVELATALAKRGIPDDAAATVLGRFTEVGLIDDRAFAAAWVDSRHAGRGLARQALAAELRRRGIDSDVVGEAVAVVDADAEERAARRLVERRLPSTRRLEQPARVRRLVGMLARKGYPPGLAMRVVRESLAAEGADPGELDGLDDSLSDDT